MKLHAIENVSAIAEFERLGLKFEIVGDSELKILCPAHKDTNPSVGFSTKLNTWSCFVCKAKGDIATFLAFHHKQKRDVIMHDLSARYNLEIIKSISLQTVEEMWKNIVNAGPLRQALRDRGVNEEMERTARLGFHEGRITIPVFDGTGNVLNIRKYLPGAPTEKKMVNMRGYGKVRLYQADQVVKYDSVIVCGGEIKALVAAAHLNPKGIGTCSATAGEGSWDTAWNPWFKGKQVWICMDIDAAGTASAKKLAEYLVGTAKFVRILKLPLDKEKYPKGDINDFIGREGADAGTILRLMDMATEYVPSVVAQETEKGLKTTSLERVTDPENIGYRLEFEGKVGAADTIPFFVPKAVKVSCTRDNGISCTHCPIKREEPDIDGFVEQVVGPTSSGILGLVNVPKKAFHHELREALRIPVCKKVEFDVISHYSVLDVRLSPQLQMSSEGGGNIQQPAFIVNITPDLNSPFLMRGRVYPHPRNQQATLVLDDFTETSDSLSSFEPDESELQALDIFRVAEGQTIQAKLDEIYKDLEYNVTHIYGRRQLHLAIDCAYHSPLFIDIGHKTINGWLNVLIVGDSSQGKSETFATMMKHYNLGEKVECKNASVAGLLGGVEQIGTRWFVKWGLIPVHDKRLICLEELKGAAVEVIGKLTDMRSSGIAEIPKIAHQRAYARTRIIAISNPRSARPISAHSFGVEAIHELIGSLEDIRRFDLAIVLAAGEIDVQERQREREKEVVPHRFTTELCRRLILWVWTREAKHIKFTSGANAKVLSRTKDLCTSYTEAIPLVDQGTAQYKLMRVAASLAGRLFSREGDNLIVTAEHVDAAYNFIHECYSDPAFGYLEYSRAHKQLNQVTDKIAVEKWFKSSTKAPKAIIRGMLYTEEISQLDIQDWGRVDRDTAQIMLSFLVRSHCIKRSGRQEYAKTGEFITILKKLDAITPDDTMEHQQEDRIRNQM